MLSETEIVFGCSKKVVDIELERWQGEGEGGL